MNVLNLEVSALQVLFQKQVFVVFDFAGTIPHPVSPPDRRAGCAGHTSLHHAGDVCAEPAADGLRPVPLPAGDGTGASPTAADVPGHVQQQQADVVSSWGWGGERQRVRRNEKRRAERSKPSAPVRKSGNCCLFSSFILRVVFLL